MYKENYIAVYWYGSLSQASKHYPIISMKFQTKGRTGFLSTTTRPLLPVSASCTSLSLAADMMHLKTANQFPRNDAKLSAIKDVTIRPKSHLQFSRTILSCECTTMLRAHTLWLSSCTLWLCRINKASLRIIQSAAASSHPIIPFPTWIN